VVCQRCRQWNLVPLELRWEAVEECERHFSGTSLRTSTENIGLARLPDGLELIRIGKPLRPELASWRYGAAFRDRRRRNAIPIAGVTAGTMVAPMLLATGLVGFAAGMAGVAGAAGLMALMIRSTWHPRVKLPNGRVQRLDLQAAETVRLEPDDSNWKLLWDRPGGVVSFSGVNAERALRSIVAGANLAGGSREQVTSALSLLDASGDAASFLVKVARSSERHGVRGMASLPQDVRLAVEMALHEDVERRAMVGELARLEEDWRAAEEVAAIADRLLLPDAVMTQAYKLRDRVRRGRPGTDQSGPDSLVRPVRTDRVENAE